MIDTHAHLDHLENLKEALDLSLQEGIEAIIAMSEDLVSSKRNYEISVEYDAPKICVAMGMHPSKANRQEWRELKEYVREKKEHIVAIGEIGLDFWYPWVRKDSEKKEEQKEVFFEQLQLAKELGLPVSIHSRGAWKECLSMTKESGITKAVFHWYSGPENVLEEILSSGYFISATPSLQYSAEAQKAVDLAPIERMLIETDTPVYYRNRETNEGFGAQPKDVLKTLSLYCHIKKMDEGKAAEQLNANARAFFNI